MVARGCLWLLGLTVNLWLPVRIQIQIQIQIQMQIQVRILIDFPHHIPDSYNFLTLVHIVLFTLARLMAAAAEGGAMAEAAAQADQDLRVAVTGETLVLLQARRDFAAGAAAGDVDALVAAYLIIRDVAQNCNIGTVWAAERSARDVVVLHLREGEPPNAHCSALQANAGRCCLALQMWSLRGALVSLPDWRIPGIPSALCGRAKTEYKYNIPFTRY